MTAGSLQRPGESRSGSRQEAVRQGSIQRAQGLFRGANCICRKRSMMREAANGTDHRAAAQGRDSDHSGPCRLAAMRTRAWEYRGAGRVSASIVFQGARVCPLDASEFGR